MVVRHSRYHTYPLALLEAIVYVKGVREHGVLYALVYGCL